MEKIKISPEKEKGPEKIIELGTGALKKETEIENPKRAGGFMLTTLLATGLALGVFGGEAKAQTGGGFFSRQTFNSAVFEAGSAIDRAENGKKDKIERGYVAKLSQLEDIERNLDFEYGKEKERLSQAGSKKDMEKLESDYGTAKIKIANDRKNAEKEYRKKIRNHEIKGSIISGAIQGIRGW